jgi:ketosteroid isomerase-like protein
MPLSRPLLALLFLAAPLAAAACAAGDAAPSASSPAALSDAQVRSALEAAYARNREALLARDLAAVLALRTPDFAVVTPDGAVHGYEEMAAFSRNLLENVERWEALSFDIQSVARTGAEAAAEVRQHSIRMMRRPEGKIQRVENWVTQRETWRLTADGWRIARVDNIRDQRVLIDGVPRS